MFLHHISIESFKLINSFINFTWYRHLLDEPLERAESHFLESPNSSSHRPPPTAAAAAVLNENANHVKKALESVSDNPQPQRHRRGLEVAQDQNRRRDDDECEVPNHVEHHYRLRVRPVALPLLQLLRRGLPHEHGRFPHQPPAAGTPQESRGAAQALSPDIPAAAIVVAARGGAQQRRRIGDVIGQSRNWRAGCGHCFGTLALRIDLGQIQNCAKQN